jgi:hypothetical protein
MVDFGDYQKNAGETDETGSQLVALFGAVSEIGSILAVYKKRSEKVCRMSSSNHSSERRSGIHFGIWQT